LCAAQLIGNDAAITGGGLSGTLELEVMMPVMAYNLLQSIEILSNGRRIFADKCVSGIKANRSRIEKMIDQSLALCTALSPRIGYDSASRIAKKAYESGKTVKEIAMEENILPLDELEEVMDPRRMTERE